MAELRTNEDVHLNTLTYRTSQQDNHRAESLEESHEGTGQGLPPVDTGWAAWRMLLSAFIFESLLWGFPLSFGVFQNYYSQLPEYANQPYVSVIGTVASGISYMGAPVIIPLLKRARKYRTYMIWLGWTLCIVGVLASSFAQSLGGIIFTQGVMYGVGFTVFYYPIIAMVNEFWVARRGMAYGILCSSSGVSGVVIPFLLETSLNRFGLSTTLRAVAIGLALVTGPLIPLLKGRIPISEQSSVAPVGRTDRGFLQVPLFWIYSVSNLMQGLGYFFPSLYLPSYATTLGMSSKMGALLLAIMSVFQVLGQFSFGYLSDRRFSVNVLTLTSTLVSATAILTLWGLAQNFSLLCIFAVVYGFFGAGYTAMWARMGTSVTSDTTAAFTAFGLFNFGKGLGNVFAGPIGANLLIDSVNSVEYGAAKYKAVVLFTGSCMLASAASATAAYFKPWKATSVRE
ncbi:hypothetical protein LTR67_008238 [Exophiala xenobiotica]